MSELNNEKKTKPIVKTTESYVDKCLPRLVQLYQNSPADIIRNAKYFACKKIA